MFSSRVANCADWPMNKILKQFVASGHGRCGALLVFQNCYNFDTAAHYALGRALAPHDSSCETFYFS